MDIRGRVSLLSLMSMVALNAPISHAISATPPSLVPDAYSFSPDGCDSDRIEFDEKSIRIYRAGDPVEVHAVDGFHLNLQPGAGQTTGVESAIYHYKTSRSSYVIKISGFSDVTETESARMSWYRTRERVTRYNLDRTLSSRPFKQQIVYRCD